MSNLFKRLFQTFKPRPPKGVALGALDIDEGPIYAIGDIHGCLDLLKGLEAQIKIDAAQSGGRPKLILLGDMIDRGQQTADLLDYLQKPLPWADRLCLMGNHESMMLAFLDDPHANRSWLAYGGFETLRSYGLALDEAALRATPKRRVQHMIQAYVPEEHINWMKSLEAGYHCKIVNETWVFAHAGIDPHQDLQKQPLDELIWGHNFKEYIKISKNRLVFGHVIRETINAESNWIGIDSGAYKTGRLTALKLSAYGEIKILTYCLPSREQPSRDDGKGLNIG